MAASIDIPVHDIGPLLEVRDYSIYGFMVLIAVVLATILVFVKEMRFRKKDKEMDERRSRYANFTRIDVSDPKTAAYAICEQGAFFAHDNEETLRLYHALFERLEPYKYAPTVEPIDDESLAFYRAYLEMLHG